MRKVLFAAFACSFWLGSLSAQPSTRSTAEARTLAGFGGDVVVQDSDWQSSATSAVASSLAAIAGGQAQTTAAFYSDFGRLRANHTMTLITNGVGARGFATGPVDLGLSELFGVGRVFGAFMQDSISIGGVGAGGADFRIHYFLHGEVFADTGALMSWQAAMGVGAYGTGISLPGSPTFIVSRSGGASGAFLATQSLDVRASSNTTLNLSAYLGAMLNLRQDDAALSGSFSAGLNAMNTAALWIEPLTQGLSFNAASGHDYLQPALPPIPEPGTWLLMAGGLAGLQLHRRKPKA